MSDDQLRNNGVDNPAVDPGLGEITGSPLDIGKFKVPSLRNIAVSAPYMHDGQFPTLFDVVTFYGGHVEAGTPNLDHAMLPLVGMGNFSEVEKQQLIAFLHTFTDEAFLTDPAFSAP
jgi:cytochrome c peroxidase